MANVIPDSNDAKFRATMRKIGAPEWFPQDAPMHVTNGEAEQNDDDTWTSKFVCPICGWERHFVSGEKGTMHTVAIGDKWAFHSGSIGGVSISGVEVDNLDPRLNPFAKYLNNKEIE